VTKYKYLIWAALLLMSSLLVGCNGQSKGYDQGYLDGVNAGKAAQQNQPTYQDGYNKGYQDGIDAGMQAMLAVWPIDHPKPNVTYSGAP
jgi:hypothetical protein